MKACLPFTLIWFYYHKGTKEEDHYAPLFETQVLDCEHDGDDQGLQQGELVLL